VTVGWFAAGSYNTPRARTTCGYRRRIKTARHPQHATRTHRTLHRTHFTPYPPLPLARAAHFYLFPTAFYAPCTTLQTRVRFAGVHATTPRTAHPHHTRFYRHARCPTAAAVGYRMTPAQLTCALSGTGSIAMPSPLLPASPTTYHHRCRCARAAAFYLPHPTLYAPCHLRHSYRWFNLLARTPAFCVLPWFVDSCTPQAHYRTTAWAAPAGLSLL